MLGLLWADSMLVLFPICHTRHNRAGLSPSGHLIMQITPVWRQALLGGALIWTAWLTLVTELLSLLHAVTVVWASVAWLVSLAGAAFFLDAFTGPNPAPQVVAESNTDWNRGDPGYHWNHGPHRASQYMGLHDLPYGEGRTLDTES